MFHLLLRRRETTVVQMVFEVIKWTKFSFPEMTAATSDSDLKHFVLPMVTEVSCNHGFQGPANSRGQSVIENEHNVDVLINLANALVQSQKPKDAVDVYARAFSLGTVRETHLSQFLQVLFGRDSKTFEMCNKNPHAIAMCSLCRGILIEPLTLHCGHTYCKKCLLTSEMIMTCNNCHVRYTSEELLVIKTNVTVVNVLEKIHIKEAQAAKLCEEGHSLCKTGDFQSAVEKYTEAEKLDPSDHLLQCSLSDAFLTIGKPQEALHHAEKSVSLHPTNSKGYLCKGASLAHIGQHEEAFIAYLTSYVLAKHDQLLNNIIKLMYRILQLEQIKKLFNKEELSNTKVESESTESTQNVYTCFTLSSLCENTLRKQSTSLRFFYGLGIGLSRPKPYNRDESRCTIQQRQFQNNPKEHTGQKSTHLLLWKTQTRKLERIVTRFEEEIAKIKDAEKCVAVGSTRTGNITKKDLECSLCMQLFWQPVTTPCGHTFCRRCLDRCLDHKPHCPLCQQSICGYLAERHHATTELIETIMKVYVPSDYQERKKNIEEELEELSNAGKDPEHGVPLFVCTMAYPDIHCPLHIFEPRYRLMTRQCMESGTREFGMCVQQDGEENRIAKYGTMLAIRDISYYPDGRSIVDAIGTRRFKVLQTSMRDGYHIGSVEFISDRHVPDSEVNDVKLLHDEVYSEVSDWFSTVPAVTHSRILQYFGPLPAKQVSYIGLPNGPHWMWWTLAILPIDVKAQVQILGIDSLKKRLQSLQRVLRFVHRFGPQGLSQ